MLNTYYTLTINGLCCGKRTKTDENEKTNENQLFFQTNRTLFFQISLSKRSGRFRRENERRKQKRKHRDQEASPSTFGRLKRFRKLFAERSRETRAQLFCGNYRAAARTRNSRLLPIIHAQLIYTNDRLFENRVGRIIHNRYRARLSRN